MSAIEALLGARVRRLDAPNADLWAITLAPGEIRGTLLISLQPGAAGLGWAAKRPHGQPATSFVQKLRRELEGGRLRGSSEVGATLELHIERAEQRLRLVFDFATQNVLLYAGDVLRASARKVSQAGGEAMAGGPYWPADLATLEAEGHKLLESRKDVLFATRRAVLAKALGAARKRLQRRLEALVGDAARAERAPALRAEAQLLLANLHAIPRGAKSVRLLDYSLDPPDHVEIALDPTLDPRAQAEAWFKRAKRFERGAAHAAQRTAASQTELAALEQLATELAACSVAAELDDLVARAEQLGVRTELAGSERVPDKPRGPPRHVPYRTFRGSGGRTILVGKGAADNDALTREYARPQDLWLHARDTPGAHVVVPLERTEVCPPELLIDAALLAVHFSDLRGEAIVDVSHTPRRYVRKPKGAAVGSVILEREKVVRIHADPRRIAGLLATQRD